jgi:cob(I)alamin adenosyltransferase
MKIYTRTGDSGETGLFGGSRIDKDAERVEAYGTLDELNSVLGLVLTEVIPKPLYTLLHRLQSELFAAGAELASTDPNAVRTRLISQAHVSALEHEIDLYDGQLPPLTHFILPGGSRAAATLHLARTVCRRAERRVVALSRLSDQNVSAILLAYLNRLSDLIFVLARAANEQLGFPDTQWTRNALQRPIGNGEE